MYYYTSETNYNGATKITGSGLGAFPSRWSPRAHSSFTYVLALRTRCWEDADARPSSRRGCAQDNPCSPPLLWFRSPYAGGRMSATFPTTSQSQLGHWPTLCTVLRMLYLAVTVRQSQAGAEVLAGVCLCSSFESVVVVCLNVGLHPQAEPKSSGALIAVLQAAPMSRSLPHCHHVDP